MSANRSVQAAQRRRAGGPEPAAPGRGPQPSINSSQLFSGQGQGQQRSGQVPSGRLAGQHAQLQQQQHQQQQQQHLDAQQANGIAGINKMTFAQAVTLITLRLGKLETQMFELSTSGGIQSDMRGVDGMVLVEQELIDSIMSRLASLEGRPVTTSAATPSATSSASSTELVLLKQQLETIKPTIAQNTKTVASLTKEQKDYKQQIDKLKAELADTKEQLNALQTLAMDNNQQIFNIMSGASFGEEADTTEIIMEDVENGDDNVDGDVDGDDTTLVGANLKGMIEQELNSNN
jgi:hypothetical protein